MMRCEYTQGECNRRGCATAAYCHAMEVLNENLEARNRKVEEGCTPADARMLRRANFDLAGEIRVLRHALESIINIAKAGESKDGN